MKTSGSSFAHVREGLSAAPEYHLPEWLMVGPPPSVTPDRPIARLCRRACNLWQLVPAAPYPAGCWVSNFSILIGWFSDSLDDRIAEERGIDPKSTAIWAEARSATLLGMAEEPSKVNYSPSFINTLARA